MICQKSLWSKFCDSIVLNMTAIIKRLPPPRGIGLFLRRPRNAKSVFAVTIANLTT